MNETMTTGDVIIAGLATVGILVLIAVFIWVVRNILFKGDDQKDV